jgi:uncharacterized protein YajQ (UPF0234 family)
MTDYTRQELKALRQTLQSTLDKAGIAGITIEVGNCSYEGGEATFKVKVTKEGAQSAEERNLVRMANAMQFDTSKVGTINGQIVKLVGYNINARKMPWMVGAITGDSKWKLTNQQAKRMFGKTETV